MNTLIAIGVLAVLVLIAEIINLRKWIIPLSIVGLLGILGYTINDISHTQAYFNNMFISTKYASAFSSLFIALTILILGLSKEFYSTQATKIADYVSLKLFLLMGAICMVSFGNLAMFFLGLEILSITLYILCGTDIKNIKSNEAAMKYFLLGSFASGIVLFGIAFIYGATASFDIVTIKETVTKGGALSWYPIGVVLVIIGMLFKIAAVPFHFWAPDVYQGAPTLTTAMMSTLVKVTAMATLYKICVNMMYPMPDYYLTGIIIISIATMTVGNIMALTQENIKRLLAYSGISHAGFMMIALTALQSASSGLFYYACAYSIAGIAAFTVVIAVGKGKSADLISNFNGLGKRNPTMAIIMSIALLSMGGIPIFAGFFGKFFLFTQAISNGFITLVIFAAINSFISIYYYLKVIIAMYSNYEDNQEEVKPTLSYTIIGSVCAALSIIMGLYPEMILQLIK